MKQLADSLKPDAINYLKWICELKDEESIDRDNSNNEMFGKHIETSLNQVLDSKHRVQILLETEDNEARIYLYNYYIAHKLAMEKAEKEVAEVKHAINALELGSRKLDKILSGLVKQKVSSNQSTCGNRYNYYQMQQEEQQPLMSLSRVPSENEENFDYLSFLPQPPINFKRRSNALNGTTNFKNKGGILKHRKEVPDTRDEILYCICRKVSYGDMVGCDNEACEIEWFHYKCVGLTTPPKGAWYCDQCLRKTRYTRD